MTKLEELKMYRDIIIDIDILRKQAEENLLYRQMDEYLSNQTNELFGIDPKKDKPKVKMLRLYQ